MLRQYLVLFHAGTPATYTVHRPCRISCLWGQAGCCGKIWCCFTQERQQPAQCTGHAGSAACGDRQDAAAMFGAVSRRNASNPHSAQAVQDQLLVGTGRMLRQYLVLFHAGMPATYTVHRPCRISWLWGGCQAGCCGNPCAVSRRQEGRCALQGA